MTLIFLISMPQTKWNNLSCTHTFEISLFFLKELVLKASGT